MSDDARDFVHKLRVARHITVVDLAGEIGLTKGQYYYRLDKGEVIDPNKMFDAVISIDARQNKPPLYPEQVQAFRNAFTRMNAQAA